jgi:CRP-like cAMP-binding protein
MAGLNENYSTIDFGITHKLIASLTGLTRETVTLQMIRLEKEGIIVNKSKSVQVLNKEKLISAAKVE